MTPILYVAAWFLLAAAVFVSAFAGTLNRVALVVYSLIVLCLVFTPLLWSVIANARRTKTE